MSDAATRWKIVADGFTRQAEQSSPADWDRPTPCAGWVARDLVDHLTGWIPGFLAGWSRIELSDAVDARTDPLAAWTALADAVTALVDDPVAAANVFDHPMVGRHRLDDAVDTFITNDVLIHTWDLARATGGDETLDPDAVARMLPGLDAMGDALAASGHYQPAVALPDDAAPQARLLAASGRDPRPIR